jgi:hypothetical protein
VDQRVVTIFGSGLAEPGDEVYRLAADIARGLARQGLTIANGGYGGIMLATAEAASAEGGRVIGVTCSAFNRSRAKPIVLAGRFWQPVIDLIAEEDPACSRWLTQAASAGEVVTQVTAGLAGGPR